MTGDRQQAETRLPPSSFLTPHCSLLAVRDIHAGYGKKEILRGISLTANQGELLAIIGPNGAGKSTLLKVIAGFLRPVSGAVTLDGEDVTQLAPHERVRLGIGYFMQGGRVFPSLTVDENLAMGAAARARGSAPAEEEQILEVFPKLREMRGRRAGLLSGGERQSLALAMVLVRRPRVLLLDEPSAGLSPLLARQMLDTVKRIAQNWALTVLMVEQNVRGALGIADRVCAIADGDVAAQTDVPQQWVAAGYLERLFLGVTESEKAVRTHKKEDRQ